MWRAVSDLLRDPDAVQRALARADEQHDEDRKWKTDLHGYETKLKRIERKEVEAFSLWDGDDSTRDAMKAAIAQLRGQKRFLVDQIEIAKRRLALSAGKVRAASDIQVQMDALAARLDGANQATKAEIVKTLFPGRDGFVIKMGQTIEGDATISASPPQPALGKGSPSFVEPYCSSA